MCGRPSTTIGFERRFNPMPAARRARASWRATGEVPPRPLNMTAILATNQGRGDFGWVGEVAERLGDIPSVAPTAAQAWIAERRAMVVDVREPA